ncbi:GDSL-type esterase/lipase family protein [Geminicoccus roseus]|uniref:GDSL-type esterase/lipase family protein n=1 Tax=Geminicoccus roseus TaxID=404900 RepID=UPI0003F645FB|nr:GDSL-type esterase/lipase family protein [Geminicoccus roseus]
MTIVNRRRALGLLGGAAAAATTLDLRAAETKLRSFVAFGDSYTRSYREGVASWADQIHAGGRARLLVNLAESGATVEGYNSARTLDRQVDIWVANHRPKEIPDRTVIYMGYNDVKLTKSLSRPMFQYREQVERLIGHGVTSGGRRLVLCRIHDWSRNPLSTTSVRGRVKEWNWFISSLASAYGNIDIVDLYGRVEYIFREPARFGFTNLTEADKAGSASTHLFFDGNHFGHKGQWLLSKEIRVKLA